MRNQPLSRAINNVILEVQNVLYENSSHPQTRCFSSGFHLPGLLAADSAVEHLGVHLVYPVARVCSSVVLTAAVIG